ncbi:hypothetical protein SAMN02910356_01645 [Selenomonas sp. GACV-9]|uniref:hypothetical protein n=1 Tax=Selenomonas sp. GACV-9 TaxID=3158782 RepID=UPI0008E67033|nr:hypothetical protein SAMN02910356_01645 [Selenomonas ruminantium]
MKLKKLAAAVMAGLMVATAVPMVAAVTADMATVAYAAKGGAKLGGGAKSAPKAPAPKASAPKSSNESKSVSGNGESYKPSKDAKSLDKNAPAANSKSNTAGNTNTQSGSRWGSALRNIGLLAGGMMLGSLLASMFGGLGGGLLADILGVVMNVVLLFAAIMVIKWLWNKFRGRKEENVYRSNMRDLNMRQEPKDVTPQRMKIQDIKGPDDGYSAKSMADKYRNR